MQFIWSERYRPQTLADIVLSEENRTYFSNLKDVPNLLFVGAPGIGKTTLAKIIVKDILKCDYLYINASDENGIDTIRSKVNNFSAIKGFDGGIKVVILDEACGLTPESQKALRNTMEEYSQYTRFILTANYKHKIIPAIQSRTQPFDLTPPLSDIVKRVSTILQAEGIKLDEQAEKLKLIQLVKDNYPDIRRTINLIQKFSVTGALVISGGDNSEIFDKIDEIIKDGDVLDLRKYLIENESDFSGDYGTLLKGYLNHCYSDPVKKGEYKQKLILTISEYLYRDIFIIDKEINAFACFIAISKLT